LELEVEAAVLVPAMLAFVGRLGAVVGLEELAGAPEGVCAVFVVDGLAETAGGLRGEPRSLSTDTLLDDLLTALPGARLSALAALLPSKPASSVEPDLWKVFQSHSFSREFSHLALHPPPTPSTAVLGSSCCLNKSQFA
jgi:hypothetical protein